MKISLSWLQDYLPGDYDIEHLADDLTMAGLEVDAVSDRYDYLKSVLVGKIVAVTPHPNADHLSCCRVNAGETEFQVVCGAPNVKQDMLVPMALPGTVLPDGTTLSKTVLRGEPSEGMLCSAYELGLGEDAAGLMVLDGSLNLGQPLNQALSLSDAVLDIDLTPNRADCFSILGICREIAAIYKTKVQYPDVPIPTLGGDIDQMTSVTIESPEFCPRYAARLVFDITVTPSPFWLQDRLCSIGLRPINNVVDITNFVMLETGQPLHAFDYDRLAGHRIVVRTAEAGTRFTTLDDQSRELHKETLMICDGEKPVAVAGVMGGSNSEIEQTTTRVLIESACFNPASIRKTAKRFHLTTDASYRFERGVDPGGTVRAMERAAHLMVDLCRGKFVEGIIDAHPRPIIPQPIVLSADHTNRVLGTDLDADRIKELLESIEFEVLPTNSGKELSVLPPTYRVDISRPEDLMEEVARLHGYNRIPASFPAVTDSDAATSQVLTFRQRLKTLMTGLGFTEAIAYSFGHENQYDHLGIAENDPKRRFVRLLNPLNEIQSVMRSSLIPGLLDTVSYNLSRQTHHLKLFEIGHTFIHNDPDELPEEKEILAGLWTGTREMKTWHVSPQTCDFFDIKGVVETLLNTLHIKKVDFTRFESDPSISRQHPYYRKGHTAGIYREAINLGVVGEISPTVLTGFNISQSVFMFEINTSILLDHTPNNRKAHTLPRYPAIMRDITVIVDSTIEGLSLKTYLMNQDEPLVESIQLIDVFKGKPIPSGKTSLSFRVTYRSDKETLMDDMVNDIHHQMTRRLVKDFDADLPT